LQESACVKRQHAAAAALGDEDEQAPSKRRRRASSSVSPDLEEEIKQCLARFFFSSNVALHLIEHPDLVEAFDKAGVPLMTRKVRLLCGCCLLPALLSEAVGLWQEARLRPSVDLACNARFSV
jgi:hypothetical protein